MKLRTHLGAAHTIETAVLACEYLRCFLRTRSFVAGLLDPAAIDYDGTVAPRISIRHDEPVQQDLVDLLHELLRAYIAGRGEGWV